VRHGDGLSVRIATSSTSNVIAVVRKATRWPDRETVTDRSSSQLAKIQELVCRCPMSEGGDVLCFEMKMVEGL